MLPRHSAFILDRVKRPMFADHRHKSTYPSAAPLSRRGVRHWTSKGRPKHLSVIMVSPCQSPANENGKKPDAPRQLTTTNMNRPTTVERAKKQFSMRRLVLLVSATCLLLSVVAFLANSVRSARRSALTVMSQGPLNQISLALHNYHDYYGCLPPAFVSDETGRPMHSWRVLILPFLEADSVYALYDLGQPWDSPHNLKTIDQMPEVFASPTEGHSTRFTNVVLITGEGTAFPGSRSTSFDEWIDGRENTILVTEIANSTIPWTQPLDLACDSLVHDSKSSPSISAVHWRRPLVVFADSILGYGMLPSISNAELHSLITIAGGESTTRADLIRDGKLGRR